MWVLGFTFNIFSLGGVALGVGMLVDNAIVMLENISRHQAEGGDPVEAAERGSAEVESAMVASTLTNVAAVMPFLLVSGYVALLFRELILTITLAFICSLVVGLTVVAMLSARLLQIPMSSGFSRFPLFRLFIWFVGLANRLYRFLLRPVLTLRWVVIILALAVCASSYTLIGRLGNELLPQVDDGRISVDIRFSPGGTLEYTKQVTREIHDMLVRDPAVEKVFATAGGVFSGATSPLRLPGENRRNAQRRRERVRISQKAEAPARADDVSRCADIRLQEPGAGTAHLQHPAQQEFFPGRSWRGADHAQPHRGRSRREAPGGGRAAQRADDRGQAPARVPDTGEQGARGGTRPLRRGRG